MASFHSVLVFEGQEYPVSSCTQRMHQRYDHHGRPQSKVISGELSLTMPVPADTALLAWTRDPHKALACQVRFADLDSPWPGLTLALDQAYCVSYAEHFESDADGHTAYYLQLSIVAERIDKQGIVFDNRWTPKA